jgi:hypothetical protein
MNALGKDAQLAAIWSCRSGPLQCSGPERSIHKIYWLGLTWVIARFAAGPVADLKARTPDQDARTTVTLILNHSLLIAKLYHQDHVSKSKWRSSPATGTSRYPQRRRAEANIADIDRAVAARGTALIRV